MASDVLRNAAKRAYDAERFGPHQEHAFGGDAHRDGLVAVWNEAIRTALSALRFANHQQNWEEVELLMIEKGAER
jgi:hypothetical protein